MERIVLDTNVVVMSISPKSHYRKIWDDFLGGKYQLCISNEIVEEYSEILSRNISPVVSDYIVNAILTRDNVVFVEPHFRCRLIEADPDDNKFVDCAFACGARFIVSEDHHFDILYSIPFPKIDVIKINDFLNYLSRQGASFLHTR